MNRHVPPPPPVQVANARPTDLQHLVRKHEELDDLIGAARSHAQPTTRLWAAMVAIEDRMRVTHPRAYTHWIAVWALRSPRGQHPIGAASPECSLCTRVRPTELKAVRQAVCS
jgi:hypothetical protein